jgi:two-component system, OmpR family, response regulator
MVEEKKDRSKTRNLLIIDDDQAIRKLIKMVARNYGVNVVETGNGKEALEHLHEMALKNSLPDLMFIDIYMPYMDGIIFCNKLKEESIFPLDKVFIVTAMTSEDELNKLRDLGVGGFLRKPFSLDEIRKIFNSRL